jgi:phage tail protein X
MNNRYTDIKTKKSEDGKRVIIPTLYPPIPRNINDIYVITSVGDRLDQLAYKYYGRVNYYWIIAEANGVGKGTMVLEGGIQLRIPTDTDTILREFNELNK